MDDYIITANWKELLEDTSIAMKRHLHNAKKDIDEEFGEGYARENPTLVAAYIQSASLDFSTATKSKVLSYGVFNISSSLSDISNAIKDLEFNN